MNGNPVNEFIVYKNFELQERLSQALDMLNLAHEGLVWYVKEFDKINGKTIRHSYPEPIEDIKAFLEKQKEFENGSV